MKPFEHSLGSSPTLTGARTNTAAELAAGTVLGNYRIVRLLGAGGMGAVYLVEHVERNTRHALKTIRPEFAKQKNFAERFLREAKLAARLKHPHIVACTETGVTEGIPYLVMDYIEGPAGEPLNLRQLLDQRRERGELLDEDEAAAVGLEICKALDYAHSYRDAEIPNGIIHRDLKPANILLDKDTKLYIADFGLARLLGEKFEESVVQAHALSQSLGEQATLGKQVSVSADTVGTFDYMSPEQREGRIADARSDIFAMGAILYELLTGRKVIGVPAPPSKVRPGLNPLWDEIILERALAYEPEERYATAGEFCRAIESVPAKPQPAEPPDLVSPPAVTVQPKPMEPAKPQPAEPVATAEPKPEEPAHPAPATPAVDQPEEPQVAAEAPEHPETKSPRATRKIVAVAAVLVVAGLTVWWVNSGQKQAGLAQKPTKETKTIPAEELRRGLVLHFNFDQDEPDGIVKDQSGLGNHGRVFGAKWTAQGRHGGAYSFDMGDQTNRIVVPNSASLNPAHITLAAWIKTSFGGENWGRIMDKDFRKGYCLNLKGPNGPEANPQAGYATVEIDYVCDPATERRVDDGQWHHVVATHDGKTQWIYLDGQPQRTGVPVKGPISSNAFDLTIGNSVIPYPAAEIYPWAPTIPLWLWAFNGLIDEVMIYNRALTKDEVWQLYEQGSTPAVSAAVTPPATPPKLRYGLYIHFGLSTFTGYDTKSEELGRHSVEYYAPKQIDCRQWAQVAKQAGMDFAILTAKHESGFCLWPATGYDYSVATSPVKTDVVAEFIAACQAEGITPGIHYSVPDAHNEGKVWFRGAVDSKYFEWIKRHLTELLRNYPALRVCILDTDQRLAQDEFRELLKIRDRENPACLILGSAVNEYNGQHPGNLDAAHKVGTVIKNWFWSPSAALIPAENVSAALSASLAEQTPYILNVAPDTSGRIPAEQFNILMALKPTSEAGRPQPSPSIAPAASAVTQAAPLPGYKLAWSDEFNGTALDLTKWNDNDGLGDFEDGVNVKEAVTVTDGCLTISTYTENGKHYTGRISTRDRFEHRYGYYEARMKFSGASGIYSSFTIKPLDEPVGDPAIAGTLINIVGYRGRTATIANEVQHSVIWDGFLPNGKIKCFQTDDLGLASGFHLYAVEWTDKEYRFFVDGKLTWSAPTPVSKIAEHILLCSKVKDDGGNGWAGAIPLNGYGGKESSKTKMLVDYVRVYERIDAAR